MTAAERPDTETRAPRAAARHTRVPVRWLRAHPRNIRADLGDLRELAESIRHEGVLVPLMAENRGSYGQLLHGHRRWAAAQLAGVTKVPAVIVDVHTDDEAILVMLAEDKKLSVAQSDRARAVRQLRNEFGHSWTSVAARLGVSVGTVKTWANSDQPRPTAPAAKPRRALDEVTCPQCARLTGQLRESNSGFTVTLNASAAGAEDGFRCTEHRRTPDERAAESARALASIAGSVLPWSGCLS